MPVKKRRSSGNPMHSRQTWNRSAVGRQQQQRKLPRPQAPQQQVPQQKTPAAANIQAPATALSGGTGTYNIASDPAVMAAQGLAAKIRAQAQASALAKRQQAAIEYGDPTGVEGIDEKTSQAARDNPFSVLKNVEHSYDTGVRELEEGLNSANLFYSGYRGQQLGEAARGLQQSKYQAGTNFRGLMSDINDQLAGALMNADAMDAQTIMGSSGGYYDGGGYDSGQGGDVARLQMPISRLPQGPYNQVFYGTPAKPKPKPNPPYRVQQQFRGFPYR